MLTDSRVTHRVADVMDPGTEVYQVVNREQGTYIRFGFWSPVGRAGGIVYITSVDLELSSKSATPDIWRKRIALQYSNV